MSASDDIKGVVDFANNAFGNITTLLELGQDVMGLIQMTRERLEAMANQNRGPSDEERAAQNAMIRDLQNQLNTDDPPAGG